MAKNNKIKRLGVCGDSWMSAVQEPRPGHSVHFTQQIAKYFGAEYVTYARGACSNSAIRLQIDACIKAECDYVIIKDTTNDRGEFPIGGGYRYQDGILNILYHGDDVSAFNPEFMGAAKNASLLSNTFNNIVKADGSPFINENTGELMGNEYHGFDRLSLGQINNLGKYILFYHDTQWRNQQDSWILRDGLRELESKNIKYMFITTITYNTGLFEQGPNVVLPTSPLNPVNNIREDDPNPPKERYHMHASDQEELAKRWIEVIRARLDG